MDNIYSRPDGPPRGSPQKKADKGISQFGGNWLAGQAPAERVNNNADAYDRANKK